MPKKTGLTLVLILLLSLISALPLRVLYTGDTHGAWESKPLNQDGGWKGGYQILEHHLAQQRNSAERSIYLDSGDQQTGSVFSSLVEDGVVGGAVVEVFNRLGLEACTFGNHEFDFSYSNTRDLVKLAKYPFLSANLIDRVTGKTVGSTPYALFDKEGIRVGVLGLTLVELPEKVKAENVASLDILPYKEAVERYLDELDKQSDLIILLTHNGFRADSLLAESLDDRVDLIIGGHDHIALDEPYRVNGKYLLYSGSHLNYLGCSDIEVENDRVASLKTSLIPLAIDRPLEPTPISEYVTGRMEVVKARMSEVIAHIPEDWNPGKYQETAVSRWVAQALKAEYEDIYHPDLAIINNGGIRKAIPAGPVTLGDMHEMLPFNNTVVVFSCYGRDIIAFDELNAQHAVSKPHDICQSTAPGWPQGVFKGDRYPEYDPMPWRKFDLGGKDLDPDTRYRVVSHDYIAGQWDKYLGFKPFDVYDTGELLLDAMIRQVQKQYPPSGDEGRD
jgi:2',3'-cyclic-nucleotide 2'-phosphodiesterase (5'-nucleotidase family)